MEESNEFLVKLLRGLNPDDYLHDYPDPLERELKIDREWLLERGIHWEMADEESTAAGI